MYVTKQPMCKRENEQEKG